MLQVSRRGLIGSLGALFVAPAIVRAESLMKVKPVVMGNKCGWLDKDYWDRSTDLIRLYSLQEPTLLLVHRSNFEMARRLLVASAS